MDFFEFFNHYRHDSFHYNHCQHPIVVYVVCVVVCVEVAKGLDIAKRHAAPPHNEGVKHAAKRLVEALKVLLFSVSGGGVNAAAPQKSPSGRKRNADGTRKKGVANVQNMAAAVITQANICVSARKGKR